MGATRSEWLFYKLKSVYLHMKMELLAPVGSPASLRAAVEAGADSVYMGAIWNARVRARNFS